MRGAFAKLAPNIVVKVPMSEEGLEAISTFADEGIKTNCTLIFSANQGLLAAKAGAPCCHPSWVVWTTSTRTAWMSSGSWSRLVELHGLETEVLTASVRGPRHVTDAALAGSQLATLSFKVLKQMVHHPLTDFGHHPVPEGLGLGQGSSGGHQVLIRARPLRVASAVAGAP